MRALSILLLALMPEAGAQSHDPKAPSPLGAGVNKGNVDNKTGPNYYYFYAGPGHIDLKFAFKSLGVFGNPLRQNLSFDLYGEDGKLISHNTVGSLDQLEHSSAPGDLGSRHKLTLRVIAPETALKLGGYYEIEVTGAATFDSSAATGAGGKPQNTELYHAGTSLYEPGATTYKPGQALTVQDSSRELRLYLAADVLFDFDKSSIRPDATATLHQVAAIVLARHRGMVRVEGYTDSKGGDAYNVRLSEQRAAAVKAWLVAKEGLDAATFSTRGFGSANPVVPNARPDGGDDQAGRQRNRRVEVVIAK
jgi:outer membrane protein OmpA-like peptidoglycan-associated protein